MFGPATVKFRPLSGRTTSIAAFTFMGKGTTKGASCANSPSRTGNIFALVAAPVRGKRYSFTCRSGLSRQTMSASPTMSISKLFA